jgi:hypothetical protein
LGTLLQAICIIQAIRGLRVMRAEVPATAPLGEEVMLTIDERAAWALNAWVVAARPSS